MTIPLPDLRPMLGQAVDDGLAELRTFLQALVEPYDVDVHMSRPLVAVVARPVPRESAKLEVVDDVHNFMQPIWDEIARDDDAIDPMSVGNLVPGDVVAYNFDDVSPADVGLHAVVPADAETRREQCPNKCGFEAIGHDPADVIDRHLPACPAAATTARNVDTHAQSRDEVPPTITPRAGAKARDILTPSTTPPRVQRDGEAPPDGWLTLVEAANAYGCAYQTIHARTSTGVLPSVKVAGRRYVPPPADGEAES